jgi:predicted extracellular nuclease
VRERTSADGSHIRHGSHRQRFVQLFDQWRFELVRRGRSRYRILNAGYLSLLRPATDCSYVFDGQLGSLDYALASAALAPDVVGAKDWDKYNNPDEIPVFNYNDGILTSSFDRASIAQIIYTTDLHRSSDHDLVLVVFSLTSYPFS